jgi:hypothetical protein
MGEADDIRGDIAVLHKMISLLDQQGRTVDDPSRVAVLAVLEKRQAALAQLEADTER